MHRDELIRDYLVRLEAAAWPLAVDRRAELRAEVEEHIESALAETGRADEATVRSVLERLGRPEEIVSAELAGGLPASQDPRPLRTSPFGALEIIALALLSFGGFLPILGAALGLAGVWMSGKWLRRERWTAVALVLIPFAMPVIVSVTGGLTTESESGGAGALDLSVTWLAIGAVQLGGIMAAIYLAFVLSRRARA